MAAQWTFPDGQEDGDTEMPALGDPAEFPGSGAIADGDPGDGSGCDRAPTRTCLSGPLPLPDFGIGEPADREESREVHVAVYRLGGDDDEDDGSEPDFPPFLFGD